MLGPRGETEEAWGETEEGVCSFVTRGVSAHADVGLLLRYSWGCAVSFEKASNSQKKNVKSHAW